MTWKIIDKANGHVLSVSEKPRHAMGVWECGNLRLTDPTGEGFEPMENQYNSYPSVPDFWGLFTFDERTAIRASTDAEIADFVSTLGDARLTNVNMESNNVSHTLNKMVTLGLVTSERMNTIKFGVPIP